MEPIEQLDNRTMRQSKNKLGLSCAKLAYAEATCFFSWLFPNLIVCLLACFLACLVASLIAYLLTCVLAQLIVPWLTCLRLGLLSCLLTY